jgi:hypothetical protein
MRDSARFATRVGTLMGRQWHTWVYYMSMGYRLPITGFSECGIRPVRYAGGNTDGASVAHVSFLQVNGSLTADHRLFGMRDSPGSLRGWEH